MVAAPAGALVSQMAEPLRVTETLKPVSVKQLRPGVFIFDMGQNMVGWCRLHVAGPKGTQVMLRHSETLNPDGSLYVANLRSARATDIYTLKGEGTEVWEPRFTYHGFRYVEVTGYPGQPTAAALEGRVVHDDMNREGDFTSSNDLLNKIHHNMFWGIRGNYRSIPTDCPQRDERQGWLGDRSQVSRSESYMFDVAAFYYQVDAGPGRFAAPDRQHPGRFAKLLAVLQRRPHLAEHLSFRAGNALRPVRRPPCARAGLSANEEVDGLHTDVLPEQPDLQGSVRRLVRSAGRSEADPLAGPHARHR